MRWKKANRNRRRMEEKQRRFKKAHKFGVWLRDSYYKELSALGDWKIIEFGENN